MKLQKSKYINYKIKKLFIDDYKGLRLSEVTLDLVRAPSPINTCKTGFENGSEPNTGSVGTIGFCIKIGCKRMRAIHYIENNLVCEMRMRIISFP